MPSSRGPDNTVRVAISGNWNGQTYANIFHVLLTTSGTVPQADLDAWLTSFQAAYKTAFASTMVTGTTFVDAKAILYAPGGGELISDVAMTGSTSGSSAIPDNAVSTVLSWVSSVFWRGGKPRTYLPGVATTWTADGKTLTSSVRSSWVTAANGFVTAVNALTHGSITGTQFGFISYFSGNVPRTPPAFFPITGSKVHPRFGTQRRRLGKWSA